MSKSNHRNISKYLIFTPTKTQIILSFDSLRIEACEIESFQIVFQGHYNQVIVFISSAKI